MGTQIQRKGHRSSSDLTSRQDVIEEVKNAFELAERSSPGISEQFIRDVIHKLLPSTSAARVNNVMDKMSR